MSAADILALACGLGAVLCWGDPERIVSRSLGFGPKLRFAGGLFMLAAAVAFVVAPHFEQRGGGGPAAAWPLRRMSDGKAVALADFKGKAVLLNVWASWCGPCVGEMPSLLALRERLRDEPNVAFVFVSVDQDPNAATALLDQRGWKLDSHIPVGELPAAFRTPGIPATFILDRDGNIDRQTVGAEDWNTPRWEGILRKLARKPRKETPAEAKP